ncbi:uncharacterized protein LOC114361398 isoform X1 [Ostrinia furnacalis]|uniref:uncharacterized protein LOC114361398 isoform X1 n=1 Tax=Ostrinia furnacalis TaxID=93504 RepID=UPI00103C0A63|nr:uncharacterized protein LOC114361398 isoform X1 [Ostrinia furnacalis]
MSPEWDTLPLLPLRCILEHLSLEDAMAAMSTCRQWRSAILLYEGRKEKLVLRAKQLEKSMHLARVFRKHTRILHMYLDCSAEDTDEFMSYVLPQFFDSAKLREIIFIGPSYIQQTHLMPVIKIKRIMTESLIYKHLHCLERFGMLGCEMGIAKVDSEKITHKHLEYYSRPLSFSHEAAPSDTVLSRCNTGLMVFSALQSVIVDYEHINTEALETLCALSTFSSLTLNVGYRRQLPYGRLDWPRVHEARRARLRVHVNIVSLPHTKFDEVIENVLVEGMTLVSLKVLFCKAMYPALLDHLVAVHKDTLEELVWADCPYNSSDVYHRYQRSLGPVQFPVANVNPFIILTWQCTNIRRLVIHGYWMWQYDLLGFVRLRSTLTSIEVSAIYENQETYGDTIPRVLISDEPLPLHPTFVREMNEEGKYTFVPKTWHQLHPGLRARSTPQDRAAYTVCETLGVT